MDNFFLENAMLSREEIIEKLQTELNTYIGSNIKLFSEEKLLTTPLFEEGKSLLVIAQQGNNLLFRFFDAQSNYNDYLVQSSSVAQVTAYLNKIQWDDTKLNVHNNIDIIKNVLLTINHYYDISTNILESNLVWFNQQNIDAINSVYTLEADLDNLPYSYKLGRYFEPCKKEYRSYEMYCVKNRRKYYRRPMGTFSPHKLSTLKDYNRF
jgi:hypothetical protein